MKELFMCLLLNLKNHGNITAASLYRDSKFASIEIESEDAVYTVNIAKEEKKDED
jgi:hypothetical protein